MTLGDLNTVGTVLAGLIGGGGVWSYLASKSKTKTDLITIAQDAARDIIQDLRDELDRVMARCIAAEKAHETCQVEMATLRRQLGVPAPEIIVGSLDRP